MATGSLGPQAGGRLPGIAGQKAADPLTIPIGGNKRLCEICWPYSSRAAGWLGYQTEEARAKEQLGALMQRPGFPELQAVKKNNVMAIYHQFYQSPYHFVAVQALAKWLHPDRFVDLDPHATFAELHEKFLPIGVSGVFWTMLD